MSGLRSSGSTTEREQTPESTFRNRSGWRPAEEPPQSPSSETASSLDQSIPRTSRSFQATHNEFSGLPSVHATPFANTARRTIIRADPAMTTCFDASDKELYDLWVPRS